MPREKCQQLFHKHLTLIKRVVFSRSLRLLPLPEQVGAIEALAVIVDQLPDIIPLNDQHLLAFLSELLKMSSVADGEMTDANLVGNVVDKNGFSFPPDEKPPASKDAKTPDPEIPASALFLRRDCILSLLGAKIVIGEELPYGIQLRVSAISLLHSVIRGHPNPFFDAETSSPVGKYTYTLACMEGVSFAVRVSRLTKLSIRTRRKYTPTCNQSSLPIAGFMPLEGSNRST